jgi:hypothetical protein
MITRSFAIGLCFLTTNAPTHNNLAYLHARFVEQRSIPFLIHDLMSCFVDTCRAIIDFNNSLSVDIEAYVGSYRVVHSMSVLRSEPQPSSSYVSRRLLQSWASTLDHHREHLQYNSNSQYISLNAFEIVTRRALHSWLSWL